MSDKARELADFIWGHYYTAEQGASEIDAYREAIQRECATQMMEFNERAITDTEVRVRKECAERAVNWRRAFGEYHQNDLLRAAILDAAQASEPSEPSESGQGEAETFCPDCGGDGYTVEQVGVYPDGSAEPGQRMCDRCEGKGMIPVRSLTSRAPSPSGEGHEPGEPIAKGMCSVCGNPIQLMFGDDEGEISVLGLDAKGAVRETVWDGTNLAALIDAALKAAQLSAPEEK